MNKNIKYCNNCQEELSPKEIEMKEDTCYPCQKGNREEQNE
jgi:hypothetical protein